MKTDKFYLVYEVMHKNSIRDIVTEKDFRIGIFRSRKSAEKFSVKRDAFGVLLGFGPKCYIKEESFTETEAQEISDFCVRNSNSKH